MDRMMAEVLEEEAVFSSLEKRGQFLRRGKGGREGEGGGFRISEERVFAFALKGGEEERE